MLQNRSLFFLFLFLLSLCSKSHSIIGGDFVEKNDPIALSTVGLSNGCTGTLISSRFVLTAAHCLINLNSLEIVFGTSFKEGIKVPAESFIIHPNYNNLSEGGSDPLNPAQSPVHDIGLVKLLTSAPEAFKPVQLASGQDLVNGDPLILAGFGQTSLLDQGPKRLKSVNTVFNFYNNLALEVVFGPTPGMSACRGDSGGPMYIKRNNELFVIGVTSRGFQALGPCSGSGNYTEVKAHFDWINESISLLR